MPAPTLNVEAVTLNQESLQLAVGASATLVATVKPKNAATVEWSSSNPAIAVTILNVDPGADCSAIALFIKGFLESFK